jgi:hypothetical protein
MWHPRPWELVWLAAAVTWTVPALPTLAVQVGKDNVPAFVLATTQGDTLLGPWVALAADGTVELAGDKLAPCKLDHWLTLRRSKTPLLPPPRTAHVVLVAGDRIRLADQASLKIVDNQLYCQVAAPLRVHQGTLKIPLSCVAMIWLGGPEETQEPVLLLRQLLSASRQQDVVLLRNGDKVEGHLLPFDSTLPCRLKVGKEQVELLWANIGAIAYSTELLAGKPPAAVYYQLVLSDGTRLSVQSASLARGAATLTARTLFDVAVEVPIAHVVALDVRHGAAVYLSDLKPAKYEHKPFVGTAWPLVLDGSVTGGELRLANSTFDKGLGLHAESRVSYDLDGQYRWFEATVGLDPEHGKKGRVHIRVLVDGKEKDIGWKKELTASDGPLAVRVDVGKGRELTLEVLFSGYGDVQAHVNWVDARLIKLLVVSAD